MSNTSCGLPDIHAEHPFGPQGGLEWCPGISESDVSDSDLLIALGEAERANNHSGRCGMCDALEQMSEAAQDGVNRALGGTIGAAKLARVLSESGYPVTERQVRKHRREAHTP